MKALAVVLLIVALGAGAWFLMSSEGRQQTAAEAAPQAAQTAPEESDQQDQLEQATKEKKQASEYVLDGARRIKHGTAADPSAASETITVSLEDQEREQRINNQLKEALGGDIDILITLSRAISECGRVGNDEQRVQRRLDRTAQWFSNAESAGLPNRSGGRGAQYESFEDMENATWERFDQCQLMNDVLDEELREQVGELAQRGNVNARYLWAVWPPDADAFEASDTLKLLDYQTRALEYTWLNMDERNPLGVLAMSQSYNAFRPGMFTPINSVQAQVFTLASMRCGIDNEWLEERSLSFGQGWSRWASENISEPTLEGDAQAIADMFCPRKKD